MISALLFEPLMVDRSGQPKAVIGLPPGVVKYRCRFRINKAPVIFLRFEDRIQAHILLCSGDSLEPFELPEAVNLVSTDSPLRETVKQWRVDEQLCRDSSARYERAGEEYCGQQLRAQAFALRRCAEEIEQWIKSCGRRFKGKP